MVVTISTSQCAIHSYKLAFKYILFAKENIITLSTDLKSSPVYRGDGQNIKIREFNNVSRNLKNKVTANSYYETMLNSIVNKNVIEDNLESKNFELGSVKRITVEELIKFNESELKETDKLDKDKQKIKEPIHVIDPECKHTQIVFVEKSNNKLSEQLIKSYIRNILLEETKNNNNKPYQQGDINDMLLDEEGWVTDPNDRQKIKKWYLAMGLAHQ